MLVRVLLPLSFIAALAACNTVQGLGEDVSTAGEAVSSEAAQQQY